MDSFVPVPYYCEENIWMFLASGIPGDGDMSAMFVSNNTRSVAFLHQKNASPEGLVIWDYHVVALQCLGDDSKVWDFNTDLGLPCPAGTWFDESFRLGNLPERLHPKFRLVPMSVMLDTFISDRSHMRNPDGSFKAPPPPWSPPGMGVSNLHRFIDMDDRHFGNVFSLRRMKKFISSHRAI